MFAFPCFSNTDEASRITPKNPPAASRCVCVSSRRYTIAHHRQGRKRAWEATKFDSLPPGDNRMHEKKIFSFHVRWLSENFFFSFENGWENGSHAILRVKNFTAWKFIRRCYEAIEHLEKENAITKTWSHRNFHFWSWKRKTRQSEIQTLFIVSNSVNEFYWLN